jgi:hypothetical protein
MSKCCHAGQEEECDKREGETDEAYLKVAGLCATFFAMEGKRSNQCMEEKL